METIITFIVFLVSIIVMLIIVWLGVKCHHKWEETEMIKDTYNGWNRYIKILRCSKCG